MKKWKVVYKNEHGYIEMSPIICPKKIKKKKKMIKRKRYSTIDKILFLSHVNTKYKGDIKKAAENIGVSYSTVQKWQVMMKKDSFYFINQLKKGISKLTDV